MNRGSPDSRTDRESLAEVRRRLKARGEQTGKADFDIAPAAIDLGLLSRTGVDAEAYVRHLKILSRDVSLYLADHIDVDGALEALVQIIARRYGYGGDEDSFEDLDAANLTRVIDSRRGLPVALGILYIHVAREQGWQACGIDFPGRFLVRLEVDGDRRLFDPFEDGRVLSPYDLRELLKSAAGLDAELTPAHYREASDRDVLMRLQNNIKVRLLRRERLDDALTVIENTLLIAPDEPALWREAGMIHARHDRIRDAIHALEHHMRLDSRTESRYSTSLLLQELRGKLH